MGNTFFEMHSSPEKYNQIYDDYMRLSAAELRVLNVPKSRIYVSILDIEIIQNCLQYALENDKQLDSPSKRRMLQKGYALEEIKQKLAKRVTKESSNG